MRFVETTQQLVVQASGLQVVQASGLQETEQAGRLHHVAGESEKRQARRLHHVAVRSEKRQAGRLHHIASRPEKLLARHLLLAALALALIGSNRVFASAAGGEQGAEVEYFDGAEVDVFRPGALLFTDRNYTVKECPAGLEGQSFLRNSIGWHDVRVTAAGVLTMLTPDPAHARASTRYRELEALGFERVAEPPTFQLFGAQPFDQVRTYRKHVLGGERFRLGKWAVVVGFSKATAAIAKRTPWSENKGELLYNGIRLPEEWPPRTVDPRDTRPAPVPYLDAPPKVIAIDTGRQLFVDDFLIAKSTMERRFHHPVKYQGNPVLKPATELELNREGNAIACPKSGGLWWDPSDKQFKLWYEAGWLNTICYATSSDGIHWQRPQLDIDPGTNRVLPVDMNCDSWTVVLDQRCPDPAQRYKIFVRGPGGGETKGGTSFVSADGIHWTNRTPTGPTGDRSTMFYNPFRKKWVYSLRSSYRGRSRHYWESDDFLAGAAWKAGQPTIWAAADELDRPDPEIGETAQLYNLDAVAYESLMLGVFEIHLGPPNDVCGEQGLPKITELDFAYSRDGFHWHRPDRTIDIRAERRDVWDRGYVQSLGNVCTVRGDQLWFYYIGFQGNPKKAGRNGRSNGMYDRGSTGIAFLRRDGFASMDAAEEAAELITRPVRFQGKHLFVNIDAPRGELRAEVVGSDGQPIEPFTLANCKPVTADSTLEPVSWRGASDLAALRGRTVALRFVVRRGSLYSFWVSREPNGRSDGYVAGGGPGFTGPTDTVGRAALEAEKALAVKTQ